MGGKKTLHTISTLHYEQQRWYLLLTTNMSLKNLVVNQTIHTTVFNGIINLWLEINLCNRQPRVFLFTETLCNNQSVNYNCSESVVKLFNLHSTLSTTIFPTQAWNMDNRKIFLCICIVKTPHIHPNSVFSIRSLSVQ